MHYDGVQGDTECIVIMYRVTDAIFQFLLVWYYCTLTIREHILIINGSRSVPQICIKYSPDAVPPIHAVSSYLATDKDPSK